MNSTQSCIAGSAFRLFICGLSIITWYMGFFEPRSLATLIAATHDGAVVFWIMFAVGILGAVDVVLNDYLTALGRPPLFEHARTYRHFGFTVLAACYGALVFFAVSKNSTGLAAWWFWNAGFTVAFSLIDAYQRSKDAEACQQILN